MDNYYVYLITALLPLSAGLLVSQTNPYRALVIRGILGAIAAMVYAILGAADVALTEALVGTLLSVALCAVAVRSSLVLHVGILKDDATALEEPGKKSMCSIGLLLDEFNRIFAKRQMNVELSFYSTDSDLKQALINQEVHVICLPEKLKVLGDRSADNVFPLYQTITRLPYIQEILTVELQKSLTSITEFKSSKSQEILR